MSLPWQLGALAATSAMAGDCLSSFVKRRFGLEPSSMTLGLDQVPESLFPAVACSAYLPLGPLDVALIVLVFFVGELATSRLSSPSAYGIVPTEGCRAQTGAA
jgi:CDP-archaeol synthase